jgi:hypothetical protein
MKGEEPDFLAHLFGTYVLPDACTAAGWIRKASTWWPGAITLPSNLASWRAALAYWSTHRKLLSEQPSTRALG